MITFEVCVDSIHGVLAAHRAQATRVELCANLEMGGITPSPGLIVRACAVGIPVHVLVRPRAGNFVYSSVETDVMLNDIAAIKQSGASGVVLGALDENGDLELGIMRELVQAARPLSVTFHRAFDVCQTAHDTLEQLIDLSVDRLLTSGQHVTALEGARVIRALVQQSAGRIQIMAGSGIRAHNVQQVLQETGVQEVHFTAQEPRPTSTPQTFFGFGRHVETSQAVIEALMAKALEG
jgi:copper homeostasis protein